MAGWCAFSGEATVWMKCGRCLQFGRQIMLHGLGCLCWVVLCRILLRCYVVGLVGWVLFQWLAGFGLLWLVVTTPCCKEIVIFWLACCTVTGQLSQWQVCDKLVRNWGDQVVSLDADTSIEHRKTSGLSMLFETGWSPHYLLRIG